MVRQVSQFALMVCAHKCAFNNFKTEHLAISSLILGVKYYANQAAQSVLDSRSNLSESKALKLLWKEVCKQKDKIAVVIAQMRKLINQYLEQVDNPVHVVQVCKFDRKYFN